MTTTNPLLGRVITAIYLADDRKAIRFDLGDEQIIALVDGDCCSTTWIESIENPQAIIGAEVQIARDLDIDRLDEGQQGDAVTAFYGFQISTAKGTCTLDYRNESNGYYGGNLTWPGDYHYGGVWGQNKSSLNWKQIAP